MELALTVGGSLVKILLRTFGSVGPEVKDDVVKVMEECYERLKPHEVTVVHLYIFEKSVAMEAFIRSEMMVMGVKPSVLEARFFAIHEAWTGVPRIMLCLERMASNPMLVNIGGVRHEVAHSVLHGTLAHYLIKTPEALVKKPCRIPLSFINDVVYSIAMAVKDYEVTLLLYRRGYVEDQLSYVKHLLKITDEDRAAWTLAEKFPLGMLLYLLSMLKPLACAAPLLKDPCCGDEVRGVVEEALSHIPLTYRSRLKELIENILINLGLDTFKNIEILAEAIKNSLIEPYFPG